MFVVDDEVLLKALDESPKFRKDYIENLISNDDVLHLAIIDHYNLNLIREIYTQGISVQTYNSKKRVRLKNQEIVLIKKARVFESLNESMKNLVEEVLKVDVTFTEYFGDDYHSVVDRDFSYDMIFRYIEKYFIEYQKRSKTKE